MGDIDYIVRQGDCLESIAAAHRHCWKTLWNLPQNATLKAARVDPNVIFPGDRVFIPALKVRQESRPTEARHRFRVSGVPGLLRVRLLEFGEPLASLPCSLRFVLTSIPGETDRDGVVEFRIPPGLRDATLHVGGPPNDRVYTLAIGSLDPADEVTGMKARLNNLGFFAGPVDAKVTPDFRAALTEFQRSVEQTETGQADEATIKALRDKHGDKSGVRPGDPQSDKYGDKYCV